MIAPSSAGRSTDTARTAWKPALQSGPAGSRLWARLLAGAMLLPDRVHPRRKVAGVNALGCARAKAGGVTLTGFKPPYWGRSRTHLRNGCNRFPPCAALPSPLRRVPPCARPSFPPSAAPSSSPPCAAATLPPFARLPPVRAALPRRYADPRSASLRSGLAAPASATAPPLTRRGAACAGGWPFLAPPSRLRRPRLGSGRNSLVRRLPDSLASASGVALGVKIGGVHHASSVVLRGVLPRSLALRASGGGARYSSG